MGVLQQTEEPSPGSRCLRPVLWENASGSPDLEKTRGDLFVQIMTCGFERCRGCWRTWNCLPRGSPPVYESRPLGRGRPCSLGCLSGKVRIHDPNSAHVHSDYKDPRGHRWGKHPSSSQAAGGLWCAVPGHQRVRVGFDAPCSACRAAYTSSSREVWPREASWMGLAPPWLETFRD